MQIKKITLENYKAIENCELTDLGHINIICGKNNSGKSSVLEAIKNYQKRKNLQIVLSADDIRGYFSELYQSSDPNNGIERKDIKYLYGKISTLQDLVIAYSNSTDLIKFYQDLAEKINIPVLDDNEIKVYMKNLQTSDQDVYNYFHILKSFYDRILNIDPKLITIPSKRNPEVNYSLGNTQPNSFEFEKSYDLIYFLFYSKNQPFDTKDFKKYVKLKDIFKEISGSYDFDVAYTSTGNEKASLRLGLKFSSDKDKWFDADQSGLGLRDLLVILSYIVLPDKKIILIEEPENHLHAEMQRKLLTFFKKNENKQFFITTHSNVFLDSTFVDRIFQTTMNDGKIIVTDATNKANILQDLGYSVFDNLISDLVILVEGKTDKHILEVFLLKMGVWGKYNIKIWPLGGSNMEAIDLSAFTGKTNIIALIDQDPESAENRENFEELCKVAQVDCTRLERYAIENYFTLRSLLHVHKDKPAVKTEILRNLKEILPNISLFKQIDTHLNKRNIEHKYVAENMELEDIKGTDLYEFLEKVKDICKKNLPYKNLKTESEKI